MNQIKVFENAMFGQVRTLEENGGVLFCGGDVARALGYAVPRKALLDHCKGVLKRNTLTNGGMQEMSFIPEGDLYRLITHSKLPTAEQFERWVFDEVLPDIRRHGMYANEATLENLLADPDSMITVLKRYRDEKQKRMALQAKVEQDAPKVLFADTVEASEQSILVGVLAKLLKQRGIEIGQNRLFELLRRDGYLCSTECRWNMPTQRAMEMQLFEVRERSINNPDGSVRLTLTTMVTGKGQVYFVNKYRRRAGYCEAAL